MHAHIFTGFLFAHKPAVVFLFTEIFYNVGLNINYYLVWLPVNRHPGDETLQWRVCLRNGCFSNHHIIDFVRTKVSVVVSQLAKRNQIPMAPLVIYTHGFYLPAGRFIFFGGGVINLYN